MNNDMQNTEIATIRTQVELELANKETVNILVTTTFKGLQPETMKRAMIEGMMRGFSFKDFLEKNIYAIPYSGGYSLVTSIDYARKVGMRSGVIGKSIPIYEEDSEGKLISCEITIKRRIGSDIGEFTALVFMSEYSTGKNLWSSKPRTMLAKVAEMHALRMACPEELGKSFIEEEMTQGGFSNKPSLDIEALTAKLKGVKSEAELKTVWSLLPAEAKKELTEVKNEMKKKFIIDVAPKTEPIDTSFSQGDFPPIEEQVEVT